jgi:hypothetical protein
MAAFVPVTLPSGLLLSVAVQQAFRGYGCVAHTLGAARLHGRDCLALDQTVGSAFSYFELELGGPAAVVAQAALEGYADFAENLPSGSALCPYCSASGAQGGDDPNFTRSGANADLVQILTAASC